MTNYYYSENPEINRQQRQWNFELMGNQLHFTTDNGVFSKRTVDFGSRTLLEALMRTNQLANLKGAILDVGCGYGPIGLAIAKANPKLHVDMIDVNELALDLARQNAHQNHLDNVGIFTSNVYDQVKKTDYEMIISNPPIRAGKEVVHSILSGAYDHLKTGGFLTIVIQKKQGAPSAEKKMKAVFGNCQLILRNKGYQILQSQKVE